MLVVGRVIPVRRPVLVAGDLGTTGLVITQALRLLGFRQVDHASDIKTATEWMGSVPYALIVCAARGEHLDAFSLLRLLRADPLTATIPFILVSGQRSAALTKRARAAGATGYVLKSLNSHELSETISHILTAPEEAFSGRSRLPSLQTAEEVIFGPEQVPLH